MALASPHTFAPGELLTAANLQGIETNILTNPITLISPTTGAINFNLSSHYGLQPSAVSASSGSAGQALVVSGTAAVWGAPTVATTNLSIVTGSTGQVLAVTSSNSAPAFQVIPLDGGLSTSLPSTGMVYFVATSGNLKGLAIGTSGQVLTVSTALLPSWATPSAASGGGGGGAPSTGSDITHFVDFILIMSTNGGGAIVNGVGTVASTAKFGTNGGAFLTPTMGGFAFSDPNTRGTIAAVNPMSGGGLAYYSTAANFNGFVQWGLTSNFASTNHFSMETRFVQNSTASGKINVGFLGPVVAPTSTSTTGIYLTVNATAPNTELVCVTSSGGEANLSAGVSSTAPHTFLVGVTSSAVTLTVDGGLVGSIGSSAIPNVPLTLYAAASAQNVATSGGIIVDYLTVITTAAVRT